MRAELGLPSVRGDDEKGGGMMGGFGGSMGGVGQGGKSKRPISVKFEIPYFTTSGIQVRYLKIIEPKVRFHLVLSTSSLGRTSGRTPTRTLSLSLVETSALSGVIVAFVPTHASDGGTSRRVITTCMLPSAKFLGHAALLVFAFRSMFY